MFIESSEVSNSKLIAADEAPPDYVPAFRIKAISTRKADVGAGVIKWSDPRQNKLNKNQKRTYSGTNKNLRKRRLVSFMNAIFATRMPLQCL